MIQLFRPQTLHDLDPDIVFEVTKTVSRPDPTPPSQLPENPGIWDDATVVVFPAEQRWQMRIDRLKMMTHPRNEK